MPQPGVSLLRERLEGLPVQLRALARQPDPELAFDPAAVRRILVSGLGSSAAQARYLAHLLSQHLGLPARAVSAGALGQPPGAHAAADALVVFSQGLSPNARFALSHTSAWGALMLVTGVSVEAEGERGRWRRAVENAGAQVVPLPAPDEFGTLARVSGPLLAYAVALSLARAFARAMGRSEPAFDFDVEHVCARVASADASARAAFPESESMAAHFAPPRSVALLASEGYGELAQHLRAKFLEGMWLPHPPLWDVLEFAHGGFQQIHTEAATLLYLERADAAYDADALARVARMIDPERHALRRLRSELPGACAIFDHEAQLNSLMLRYVEERDIDPAEWPGRERDAPLYALAPPRPPNPLTGSSQREHALTPGRRLERLTWPQVDERLREGARTAVVPLGSTEQHGPHLPFATDTWIADRLAAAFCQRVPEALQVPAVPFGCASEHMDFPGTLDLRPASFEAVLCDLLRSLATHGFERLFVFSAHGGNLAVLREMKARLERSAAPARLCLFTDHRALGSRLREVAADYGVTPGASGHHAGELETSLLLAMEPGSVRRDALAPGVVAPPGDAQQLFYPSLRANSENGVVGDPRGADAARAAAYLAAWADLLAEGYRSAVASALDPDSGKCPQ